MVWINTYAPVVPMWSGDGVSGSHASQLCRILAPLVIVAQCLAFSFMGFVIDLRGPGGNVGIVQRTIP